LSANHDGQKSEACELTPDVSMLGSLNTLGLGRWLRRQGSSGEALLTSGIEQAGEEADLREGALLYREVFDTGQTH
jgi:hypothetical protein